MRWPTRYDVAVIGAGILGLATARELVRRYPGRKVVVIEKEHAAARHQTGHNSGVIHSGLYYTPGSAKARLCVSGRELMVQYCTEHGIPFEICGKLIVAAREDELGGLDELMHRGVRNGLTGLEYLTAEDIAKHEPAVRGLRAIWVPQAGIVDYTRVAETIATELVGAGVTIVYDAPVTDLRVTAQEAQLATPRGTIAAERVIACAGLQSDRIARMTGAAPAPKIVPFRGDYYVLRRERRALIRGLVYPVPDPRFPFLGVHFTRRIDGAVWLGPNAVLAFAREGYGRADVDPRDLADAIGFKGFRALALRYWRTGLAEMARDWAKPLFLGALRRYVPELALRDLMPGPSGVRAQALDESGHLVDDFAFDEGDRVLNVRNAPSPAATSSLALAKEFVDRLEATAAAAP